MVALIINEFKKLFSRKKTYVIFFAFAALMGLMMYASYQDEKFNEKMNSPEYQIENMKNSLVYYEDRLKEIEVELSKDNSSIDKKGLEYEKNDLQEAMETSKNVIKELEDAIASGKEIDWRADAKKQIEFYKEMLAEGSQLPQEGRGYYEKELSKLEYHLEKDIKPMKGYEFESYNFLVNSLSNFVYLLIPLFVVVLVADMVSGECTPPTLKVLLSQPVKRGKLLLAKFITGLLSALFIILFVQLLSFIITGLIGGFGDASYPMTMGREYFFDKLKLDEMGQPMLREIAGSTKNVTMGAYVLWMLALEVLFIMAAYSFGFLTSVLFKSSMISMVVAAVGTFGMTIFALLGSAFATISKFMTYMFFTYGNIPNLLDGRYAEMYRNPLMNINTAVVVMVVWIVICYGISHILFVKKDILI